MESKKLVKIHLSENLFTTAKYEDTDWNEFGVNVKTSSSSVKFYPWHSVMCIEIFEAE